MSSAGELSAYTEESAQLLASDDDWRRFGAGKNQPWEPATRSVEWGPFSGAR